MVYFPNTRRLIAALILAASAGGCVSTSVSRKTSKPDGTSSETRFSYVDSTGAGQAAKGVGQWLVDQAQDPTTLLGGGLALLLGGTALGRAGGWLAKRREDRAWDESQRAAREMQERIDREWYEAQHAKAVRA